MTRGTGLTAATATTAVTAVTAALAVLAATAAIGMPGLARAEPDLRLHSPPPRPPRLRMRPAAPKVAAAEPARAASSSSAGEDAAPRATTEAAVTGFSPLPSSIRDLSDRVVFRLQAGVDLENAPATGDTLRGGAALPSGFADSRSWIVGDAMVGARGIVLPSLGGYFLSSFQFDAGDSLATRTAVIAPGDATDQRIAIKAGYVEWGNDDRHPQSLWLRGGRQFRLDGGALFAYFDGVTVGYRTPGVSASAFAGQRVVLYVDSEAGVLFGGTAAVDLQALRGMPIRLALDYMGLAIDQPVEMATTAGATESQLRQLIAVSGSYEPSARLRADLRARVVDGDGSGLTLGRVGGRVKLLASEHVMVIGDVEQRQGGDLAYDLAAPSAVDVVDVARKLGVGLGPPIDALTVGAQVDLRYRDTEVLAFGRAELPESTPTSVDQQGWVEGGAAISGQLLKGAWLTGQYTGRQYMREDGANLEGSGFDDTAGSGLDRLHELAVDATLRSQGRGGARWRVGLGGFYRIYNQVTPYRVTNNDGRGGGRADVAYWFTQLLRVDVAAEIAQSSPILAREIGTMSSVRGSLEARW
ncbi:MAG TPA: hypothetical protein VFK02_22990 [Kofleriaceae bacterium]|nr:hypothetical protein [Kofleriaceae bacterium]